MSLLFLFYQDSSNKGTNDTKDKKDIQKDKKKEDRKKEGKDKTKKDKTEL